MHSFPIDHIIFEVTEGERVEDGPWLATSLREYKRFGFLTAIDDFGAGYAGLTLLAGVEAQQPLKLKLPASFAMALRAGRVCRRKRRSPSLVPLAARQGII